jgi:hypothetical protein
MNQERTAAANAVYETFDFGATVEDQSGWEYTTPGNEWARPVFVRESDENFDDTPSTKLTFVVRFKEGTAEVELAYAIDDKGNLWGESDDGRRIGIQIVIDAKYIGDEEDLKWLKASVEAEVQRAIAAGLLSHGHATPEVFETKVIGTRQQEEDLSEEAVSTWIEGSIESCSMSLEEVPDLMARYALTAPAEMRSELAERMGL